ncbi:MAG: protein kinase [Chloroflexota bacterium]
MHKIFDRYEYKDTDVIGIGGMGTVFRGTDTTTANTPVAIKYLKPEVVRDNPSLVDRFRREGEALSELNHPNIVKMLEAGMCDTDHYLVMEYVPGGTLRDLLDQQPKLSLQRTLYIALDLADALTRAHRLDILHRDIKPGNVLLAEDGTPRLTDFGVARTHASEMTADGQIVGTLAYISPESLTGGVVDARHDIWAFGVMLFEMLAGERPFKSELVGKLISEITTAQIPDLEKLRPDAPVALVDLVYRMLQRNMDVRIRSVRQVGAELERIIHSDGSDTPQGLLPTPAQRRFRTTTTSQRIVTSTTPPTTGAAQAPVGLVNFPVQATPFVGRVREVKEISELVTANNTRMVTLVGPGGTGKTRVAVAVAEQLRHEFPDGVYFVPLASLESSSMIPMKIAEVLGFEFAGGQDPMDQVMAFMREKTALFVMDNMEHLVDHANDISQKVENAPFIKFLATSRERLRLRGEYVYEVDSMIVPSTNVATPDELLDYPSAQLFMSSASRVAPSFKLDENTTPHVARVIALVQGMPLGIELAAGWLEMLPVEEIVQEIENSLDFLETDLRDMPERHRSIRAVFEYSWNLMTQTERETFMLLSIFRGGFERAAAQKVSGASLRVLTGLVNKSLLQRQPDGRYSMTKLLRQYAEERALEECSPEKSAEVAKKYVQNYATFIEKLNPLFGTEREIQASDALEVELENLRHAMKIGAEAGLVEELARITMPMSQFYLSRSMLAESVGMFDALAQILIEGGHSDSYAYWQLRSHLMMNLGRRGEYLQSLELADETLKRARGFNSPVLIAYTLNALAYAQMMLGQYDASRASSEEAIALSKQLPEEEVYVRAIALGNLGYLEFLAGNLEKARDIYEDLIHTLYSKTRSMIGYAFSQNNLGEIVQAMGEEERAQKLFQEAYDTFKSLRHKRGMAFSANNLAGCYVFLGDYDTAEELYKKSYRLNKEIGDRAGLGHSLSAMANVAMYHNRYEESLRFYRQAMELRKEIGDRAGYARSMTEVGMMLYVLGRAEESRPYYTEASAIAEELDNDLLRTLSGLGTGALALFDGDFDGAMAKFRQAVENAHRMDRNDMATLFVIASTSMVLAEQGMNEKAANLIGFIEAQPNAKEAEPFTRPILENLTHALKSAMGAGYEDAKTAGGKLALNDIKNAQEIFGSLALNITQGITISVIPCVSVFKRCMAA